VNATLQPQRWPLIALLAVFFLALMAALAPGLSELDLSGIGGDTSEPPSESDRDVARPRVIRVQIANWSRVMDTSRGSNPAAREAWTMMRSADAAVQASSARSASRTRSGPASWWRGGNPSRCMVAEELLLVGLDTRPRCPIGAGRGHRHTSSGSSGEGGGPGPVA
jgi:hypothetical protein